MINNRQGSRRRGRGGSSQRSSGGGNPGQRDSGNRIDSRTRGNAAQLLEKYKNMARDAQMSGDRVQVEYYLQFADHYFRVLADSRARSDDHRPIRPVDDFDGSDEEYGDEGEPIRAGEQGDGRQQQPYQQNGREQGRDGQQGYQQNGRDQGRDGNREGGRDQGREGGRDGQQAPYQQTGRDGQQQPRRDDGRQRRDYPPREDARAEQASRAEQSAPQANGHAYREQVANDLDTTAQPATEGEAKPAVRRPSTRTRKPAAPVAAEGMDADRLPPSLGVTPRAEEPAAEAAPEGEAKPKPRRRRTTATPEAQAS